MRKRMIGFLFALGLAGTGIFTAQAAQKGEWELSDDGKYWQYMYSWDEPAKDEWVEDNGKTYYLDSKGYMKTGWVTDKDDGKKYYMGPDGAMCFNMFADDGRYVGPDGSRMDTYDKYRKAIRSEIKKAAPKKKSTKTSSKKKETKDAAQDQTQQFFLLTDINGDGYRDLMIMDGDQEPGDLVRVAVWIPEDQKFQLSAEFDKSDNGEQRTLYLDPEGEEVWLEITQRSGELSLFQMEYGEAVFSNMWSFTMESDSEGVPGYYINGSEVDREHWELSMTHAKQERGNLPVTGFLPATDENQAAQIDRILEGEELNLWWE